MHGIRNIYCVGRNYRLPAKAHEETASDLEIPMSPLLFSKPTHAFVEVQGQELVLPGNRGVVEYEVELVIRIGQLYKPGIQIDELVDGLAVGIDFTLGDIHRELKAMSYPWLLAKGFPSSAAASPFMPFTGVEACRKLDFSLVHNGKRVQTGNIRNMIFDLQTIIDFTALHFGLGAGDVIFTGTPGGAGAVTDGVHMSLCWGEQQVGDCRLRLS
ncbi:fumarylacetoacetate hydrolase family protein [Paenibacillus periandrae]|uniref:fumarylacetoacetate hydrolase family protein n=1 Tax=Paenibacillus periandrae TaxID=1761741 RepID=UPI001F09228E|nr:fumarylacetoacetate hydrolase family protein [Paenibacillus periandrae]